MKKIFCIGCAVLALIMGAYVNPIEKGIYALTDTDIYGAISDITDEDDGLWIVEGLGVSNSNITIAAGAPTINSTNVYPILERWERLDETGDNFDIYNRYAHITINLSLNDQNPKFEIISVDYMAVNITPEDLKLLDVKYIMTKNNLEAFSTEEILIEQLGVYDGFMIYQVTYS